MANFEVGDIVSFGGFYNDGTLEYDATPRAKYLNKPERRWRVLEVTPDGSAPIRCEPLRDDGSIETDARKVWRRRVGYKDSE